MKCDIFISYCRDDKSLVHPFAEYINKAISRNCWIDLKGVESGAEFEDVIMRAIDECQVVLFMLSDNSLRSKWTKREVLYAEGEGKRIIPVLIDGDKLRGWFKFHFSNVDYIDIKSEEQKEKLVVNLKSWLNIDEEPLDEKKDKKDDEKKEDGVEYNFDKEEDEEEKQFVISSDVSKENIFTKSLKINVISNLWNRASTIYKWLTCSVLLLVIVFPILKWCQSDEYTAPKVNAMLKTIDSREMSQRLTEAIASNDAKTLREFAIIHDSVRAYMPYAQICLSQEEFDSADTIAERIAVLFNDNSLKSIIQHKRDSVAQVTILIVEKRLSDSLFKAADSLYINRKYDDARECIIKMDGKYRSRQDVQRLLSKIETAIANDLAEVQYDSLYNAAQLQYTNKQFKTAKRTLEKMDDNYLSRPKTKDLLAAIDKAITPTDDEVYQQALKNKDWSTIEKLANKGYSKAYYQLAQWYYSKKKYSSAKKWANKAIKAKVDVSNSSLLINKIKEEEKMTQKKEQEIALQNGEKWFWKWSYNNEHDIEAGKKAKTYLQKADPNNPQVINMLNRLDEFIK